LRNNEDLINWDDIIEYQSFPDHIAFNYGDKIYINPIVKKYPDYHKHILKHEKIHYINRTKHSVIKFIDNLLLEWEEFFILYIFSTSNFRKQFHECNSEFKQLVFSNNDRNEFRRKFPTKFGDQLYINFRPDNWFMVGIMAFLLFMIFFKLVSFLHIYNDFSWDQYLLLIVISLASSKLAFLFQHARA